MIFDVIDIEEKLGITFQNKALLKTAFTHASFANEKKIASNENLEFLGDSILNFVIAEYLYRTYPELDEGKLSQMRAAIVSSTPLYHAVEQLNVGEHVFLGVGEAKGNQSRENIFADLFEAIVAAIYIDANLVAAKRFILNTLKDNLHPKVIASAGFDYKTRLQEYAQKARNNHLKYDLVRCDGPDHNPESVFVAVLNDQVIGEGHGKSKREAQQQAACDALNKLK